MDALASETFVPARSVAHEESWIGRAFMPANLALEQASRASVVVVSLSWIGVVGLADYWTGYEWSMLIFYLIPITLGTWFVGRNYGMLLSGLSVAASVVSDIASGIPEVRYRNEAVGLTSYAIFVWLLARWRSSLLQMDCLLYTSDAADEEDSVD